MVRKLNEIVKFNNETNSFSFDFNSKNLNDILLVSEAGVYKSSINDKIYWFGYKFNNIIDSKLRTKFINWIKGLVPDNRPKSSELYQFIDGPISKLDKIKPIVEFNAFVFPRSNRSELVNRIIHVLLNYANRESSKMSFELIKNLPNDISFDFDSFKIEAKDDHQIKQVFDYVNNELLPKIHSLDYFSIAQNVRPKYRRFIKNFLKFKDSDSKNAFMSLQSSDVLIVDDINTSGSTLNEVIRIIREVNPNINIYIFTLLGKELEV